MRWYANLMVHTWASIVISLIDNCIQSELKHLLPHSFISTARHPGMPISFDMFCFVIYYGLYGLIGKFREWVVYYQLDSWITIYLPVNHSLDIQNSSKHSLDVQIIHLMYRMACNIQLWPLTLVRNFKWDDLGLYALTKSKVEFYISVLARVNMAKAPVRLYAHMHQNYISM